MPEEMKKEEEKEIEQEEVRLDEPSVEEEPGGPPDSHSEEPEKVAEGPSDEEEPTEDIPTGHDSEVSSGKGIGSYLLNKWMLLCLAGVVSATLGVALGYGLPFHLPWQGQQPVQEIVGETEKQASGLVQTGLQPFFVPLREGSEHIVIKLDIKVSWEPEALRKYRERPTFIRNNLLTYFLRVANSKEGFEAEESRLESGIGKVLEHSLAQKNIKVKLSSVTPI